MRILFLTNLLPYPLDNGGKIKSYTTISALADAGHKIDLLCFTEKNNIQEEYENQLLKLCQKVEQVYLKLTTAENMQYMRLIAVKSLFSTYSFGLYKYQSDKMKQKLEKLCLENNYECIYFDHLQLCVYKEYLEKLLPKAKMILDEHNCEALIMSRNADKSTNVMKKLFLQIESKKLAKFESRILGEMDTNIVLSEEDYKELRKLHKGDFKHSIIPIGVPDRGIKKSVEKKDDLLKILFLGTLTWEPNNQGLIWFLKNVIPLLERKNIKFKFYIVGKNPSVEVCELAKNNVNITVTGYVESVDEYYEKCDCMVVPLFIGSGQRVKLIESFSKGMPSVSTEIGAEGLQIENHKNILIANTAEEFSDAIEELNNYSIRRTLFLEGRKCYENNYSPEAVTAKINDVIRQLK